MYVIEGHDTDETPGKLGEEAYDSVRCASMLVVHVADSLQEPPQPALTAPKRHLGTASRCLLRQTAYCFGRLGGAALPAPFSSRSRRWS